MTNAVSERDRGNGLFRGGLLRLDSVAAMEGSKTRMLVTFSHDNTQWSVPRDLHALGKLLARLAMDKKLMSGEKELRAMVANPTLAKAMLPPLNFAKCQVIKKYLMVLLDNEAAYSCEGVRIFIEVSWFSFDHDQKVKRIEGYLGKRKGGQRFDRSVLGGISGLLHCSCVRGGMRKRWFLLRDDGIAYAEKNRQGMMLRDMLLFDADTAVELRSDYSCRKRRRRQLLRVSNVSRTMTLQIKNYNEAVRWRHAILDAMRECDWNQVNAHGSFAPAREGHCQLHVDGEDYFKAVYNALEQAQEVIFISDWWLTPTLPLVRPGRHSTLDKVLKDRAHHGVEVRIMLYKEVRMAGLYNNSGPATAYLRSLHKNIMVQRHPDHGAVALGQGHGAMYWSHHEKLCLIDHRIAFLGGLDLCLGRYDNFMHMLSDGAPSNQLFPGMDYANPRIRDFVNVDDISVDLISRQSDPRMPWHDVSVSVTGAICYDVARHFIQVWNYAKRGMGKSSEEMPMLSQLDPRRSRARRKMRSRFAPHKRPPDSAVSERGGGEVSEGGASVNSASSSMSMPSEGSNLHAGVDTDYVGAMSVAVHGCNNAASVVRNIVLTERQRMHRLLTAESTQEHGGECNLQMLRSCGIWSYGQDTEQSICEFYKAAISQARRFIYIENQFFVSASRDEGVAGVVSNRIAKTLVDRILEAARRGEAFRVYVVMPVMPGFEGEYLQKESAWSCRMTMKAQLDSISRGCDSLIGRLKSELEPPHKWYHYISFFSLRQVGRTLDGHVHGEQIYVHSKVIIIDDDIAFVGSANLNDRSMLGMRDSEVGVKITRLADEAPLKGVPGRLRVRLWLEHLGQLHHGPEQASKLSDVELTYLQEPWSRECWELWQNTARLNDIAFSSILHVWPHSLLQNWQDFNACVERKVGLPGPGKTWDGIIAELRAAGLRGRIVFHPIWFLCNEDLSLPAPRVTRSVVPVDFFC
eukprot:NODE_115_length_3621_cov_6.327705.p1 GENE.NODE_115_length_3621_cov_6.327705~~NODE_115_length_3621_cov_6.327705.p1  ORF type:complete len:1029 (-),score=267.23 NODE_115_length_3621_cov_6.327705:533-3445(-)